MFLENKQETSTLLVAEAFVALKQKNKKTLSGLGLYIML